VLTLDPENLVAKEQFNLSAKPPEPKK